MNGPQTLEAWQVADRLARQLFNISTAAWAPWSGPAWDQARRAALSVPLNLVEGYAWRPGARWQFHLRVANGSALEAQYAIKFLGDIGAISSSEADSLGKLAIRSKQLVWSLLRFESRQ
jgi:four helix bundle protein